MLACFPIKRFPRMISINLAIPLNNEEFVMWNLLFNKSLLMMDIFNASRIISNAKLKHFIFYCFFLML